MTYEQALTHPGVLAGTHRPRKDARRPGGWAVRSKVSQAKAQAKYDRSLKGKAARAKHEGTVLRVFSRERSDLNERMREHTQRLEELEAALNG